MVAVADDGRAAAEGPLSAVEPTAEPRLATPATLPLLAASNFAAAAAGMLIAGLLQLIAADVGWTADVAVVPPVPLSTWARLLRDVRSYPLLGLSLLASAAMFAIYAYIAPFLQSSARVQAQALAGLLFWYGIVSLATNSVVARLERAFGRDRMLVASLSALGVALLGLGFADGRLSWVTAAFALWAVSSSVFTVLQQSRLLAVAPAAGAALLALNTSATFLGQAVGTMIGGVVLLVAGLDALPWPAGGLAGLGAALMYASRDIRLDDGTN